MLYPSIDVLLEKLDSKYTLVAIASRRARDLRDKRNLLIEKPVSYKSVGMALEEIVQDKVAYETNAAKASNE